MGTGWHIRANTFDSGKPFIASAYDPEKRRHKTKRFATRSLAEQWCKEMAARLRTGQEQAGRAPVAGLIDAWEAELKRRGNGVGDTTESVRIMKAALASGLTDVAHPRATKLAIDFLAGIKRLRPAKSALAPRDVSPATRNRHLRVLRRFGNFAVQQKAVRENPFRTINYVKEPIFIKPTFSLDELAVLTDPARADDPYWLFFQVLIYAGCRLYEAAHLKWEWIDWSARRIHFRLLPGVRKKFDKEHMTPLQEELYQTLKPLSVTGSVPKQGFVFEDAFRTISTSAHGQRFKWFCKRCGIPPGKRSPHSTRHTYISLMIATGENLLLVKDAVAHESMETTAGYGKSAERYRQALQHAPRGALALRARTIAAPVATPMAYRQQGVDIAIR